MTIQKEKAPGDPALAEATKIYNQIIHDMLMQSGKAMFKITPILEEETMSDVEVQKGQSVLAKITNAPTILLTVLFYALSIVMVWHIMTVRAQIKNIDTTFSQIGQVMNQHAQMIQAIQNKNKE